MDGAAVKELAERFAVPGDSKDGLLVHPPGWVVKDPVSLFTPGPTADALAVYTLGALRDYITANRDALDLAKLVVHVVSPQIVRLVGPLQNRARNRETYVQATALNLTDNFLGKFMAIDEFIIGLQTRFARSDDLMAVLKLFGNVKQEAVRTSADDGITQTVTARTGVVLSADVPVPNPVALMPFRTFREVAQPVSLFALRVNGGTSALSVGIFEADGGAWRLEAVENIHRWLRIELNVPTDVVAILA